LLTALIEKRSLVPGKLARGENKASKLAQPKTLVNTEFLTAQVKATGAKHSNTWRLAILPVDKNMASTGVWQMMSKTEFVKMVERSSERISRQCVSRSGRIILALPKIQTRQVSQLAPSLRGLRYR